MPRKANPNKPVLETITTRAPASLYAYAKAVAAVKFGTMMAMSAEMMDRFLREEPWTKGLRFRQTQALSGRIGQGSYATGWVQVNLRLTPEMVERIRIEAERNDVSPSSFVFTAIYWWTWYIYPPKSELERRRRIEERNREASRQVIEGSRAEQDASTDGADEAQSDATPPAVKGKPSKPTRQAPSSLREKLHSPTPTRQIPAPSGKASAAPKRRTQKKPSK